MNTKMLLASTALAAAFSLGLAAPAAAQGQANQGQANQGQSTGGQQLSSAEQSLRQAISQLQNAGGQQAQGAMQGAMQGARQALQQLQQAMGQTPAERRSGTGWRNLEREVNEANQALSGNNADPARARSALQEVVDALPAYRSEMGLASASGGATGANIVIREQAAQVQVQQPQPQITVTQPEPVVTVIVPQPEIIVRQPAPQVTVQMPQPQVAVQQQQPQVRVVEAQPQVNVQPAQPQVQVRQAEPRVIVQQQGQPQIRFEQQGQAQVNVQRDGQAGGQQAQADAGVQQRTLQGQAPAAANAQTGATATPAPAQGAGAQPAAAGMPLARVQSLVGTNVVGSGGRDAGEVENLLIDRSGQVRAAVIEWGGFLGIGARRAAVPIDRIQFGANAGERARLNMTREQLEQLGEFDRNNAGAYGTRQGWGEGVRLYR